MATLPTETPFTPLRQRMLDDMAMRSMRSRTQHDYVRQPLPLLLSCDTRLRPRPPRTYGASSFTSASTVSESPSSAPQYRPCASCSA
jgi:hypothetical protein